MNLPPFQRLVDDHWRDVARLARALAGPVDGDDVAQQAWTQAYVAYPGLSSSRNLRGWLLTITHRCAMDLHRSRGRRAVPTDDDTLLAGTTRVDGPDAGLFDEELWGRVARLPERQREAVVLKYVGDLDHATIAELFGNHAHDEPAPRQRRPEEPERECLMNENAALEQQLAAWPSAELRRPVFPAADVSYVVDDTAVGRILFARNDTGALLASRYVGDDVAVDRVLDQLARTVSPRVLRVPAALDDARHQFDDFLAGRRHDFDLAVDLALATPFQRDVLETLARTVGYGERQTYGGLARAIDRPSASRAVGAALGANPLCIVVPCHRVVASQGALTGYAGGVAAKAYLLDLEAAG